MPRAAIAFVLHCPQRRVSSTQTNLKKDKKKFGWLVGHSLMVFNEGGKRRVEESRVVLEAAVVVVVGVVCWRFAGEQTFSRRMLCSL